MTLYKGKKILKKRVRDIQGNPIGMVIALNKNQLGYSVCHSEYDIYNDTEAFKIANSRAKSQKETTVDFWIKRRLRHLDNKPIRVMDVGSNKLYKELDTSSVLSYIDYIIENKDKDVDHREILALAELKIMQERANRYFKEEK